MKMATLDAAFRATVYRVETSAGRFDLKIGVADAAFDDYLRTEGVDRWGILTACNPGASRLPDEENLFRQNRLCDRLKELGWRFLAACNLDPEGDWPPEPGCCVLQVDPTLLCELAGDFSQLAVISGEVGLSPCLLWVGRGQNTGVT